MGIRGRKPKPHGLRLLEANAKPKKTSARPRPAGLETPPADLPKKGKELWKQLAPEMVRLGLLTELYAPAFQILCLAWAIAQEASQIVQKEGLTTLGDRGTLKKHPAVTMLNQTSQIFRQWCCEFGLTPSARTRVDIQEPEEPSEMEKLLRGLD